MSFTRNGCGARWRKHQPALEHTALLSTTYGRHTSPLQRPAHPVHVNVPPHPSEMVPQVRPAAAQVVGTHSHLRVEVLHANPLPHVPHATVPPHPSGMEPHSSPVSHAVFFVQPQWFSTPPPPHVAGAVQLPHEASVPPQPSDGVPQFAPRLVHVFLVQPQTLSTPPPPHESTPLHVPQSSVAPHPSETRPQFFPREEQVFGTQGAVPHTLATPPPPQV